MTQIIGLIPARGGSKGIPGKNVKDLAGKPLIAWTIIAALESKCCERVIVSTDDPEIVRVARDWGAEVPFLRPGDLALDTTPQIEVVLHSISCLREDQGNNPDYILLLQPTSPFRTSDDIRKITASAKAKDADAVVSVCIAQTHPYLTKKITADGKLKEFITPAVNYERRQDMPVAYSLNGALYLNKVSSLVLEHTFTPEGSFAYIMPQERSLDIDNPWDFYLAELILRETMRS
jgi:CMP-N,N'-diacetyllegionaminic acid synthase